MKRLLLLLTVLSCGGCSLSSGSLASLPLYVNLGATILQTELQMDVTTLTDEELAERKRIMDLVEPIVHALDDASEAYVAAINAEIFRRIPE